MRPGGPLSTSLLLGREASASLATQIGRSEWPATSGRVESPEQTTFIDYYRDFTGNAANERNNPYRNFQSFRVGTSRK
jgi:hypothetical protein